MSTQETARFEVSLILGSDGELPDDQEIIELIEDGVTVGAVESLSVTIKERTGDLTNPEYELTIEDHERIADLLLSFDAALLYSLGNYDKEYVQERRALIADILEKL